MTLSQFVAELILAVAAALVLANVFVLLRPVVARRQGKPPPPPPRSKRRVYANIVLGAVVVLWAVATLVKT